MLLWCHGRHLSGRKHTMHIHIDTQTKLRKGCCLMTSNWKTVRNTLVWLIVAMITMGIVISSPYIMKSSAASLPTVKSCKGLTVQKSGKDWVTVNAKGAQVNYTGVASNNLGWWRVENGKVNFKATGIYQNDYGWWRVETGKVNFKANQIYQNSFGWWKTTDGKVLFNENGVFQNSMGWWKVKDSKVDFSFTGIASNKNGDWYVKDGKVRFDANFMAVPEEEDEPFHPYRYNGDWYDVKSGAATKVDWKPIVVDVVKATEEEYPISRKLLIQVLQAEDIDLTEAEATYGADNAGVDYNEQAKKVADEYLKIGISKKVLTETLAEDELFTDSEVAYAIAQVEKEEGSDLWKRQAQTVATELVLSDDDGESPTGFSRNLIEAVLKDYEFTDAEIASVMAIIDADYPADSEFWNKSALIAAQSIVDDNKEEGKSISRAALKTELKDKYLFTDAQATYGANNAKL